MDKGGLHATCAAIARKHRCQPNGTVCGDCSRKKLETVLTHAPDECTSAQLDRSAPNNYHDFAIKTVKLLNDENLNSDIGSYNLQRIKDEFSINKMVNSYLQLIKENSK